MIVVSTNVTSVDGNTQANAYDYVNLKYVQYNKNTGVLTDVLSAPPPGLFRDSTVWPNWVPETASPANDANSTINLSTVFPTTRILNAIKITFDFDKDTITKTEWFQKTNAKAFTLDLSLLYINSIAELFNPNLVWGFGIYDLQTQVIDGITGAKTPWEGNEILYKGLYKIIANNNTLDYFPNPQFNNMPALRYIQASKNQIKAIGDFGSYQNGDLNAQSITEGSPSSYFLYLQFLWTTESTKNYSSVVALKKWLTETLPTLNRFQGALTSSGSAVRGAINNQLRFQIAISANNVYFPDQNGNVLKDKPTTSSTIPSSDGSWGDLNFASVVLNVSKNFYEVDFASNQIQRVHVTPTKFTYTNFSSNQLKYVPPLALQPLPWNYLAAAVQRNGPRRGSAANLNTTQWNTNYNQSNAKPTSSVAPTSSFPITQKLIAPTLQFSNNQILDFWPNNTKADGAPNDGWYTWPNTTTTAAQGEPPVVSSFASTRAEAAEPYNRSTYSSGNYSAYLHRNFLTSRPEGGEYIQSSANLLGDWKNSGYTDANDANFYRYYFVNLDNNIELISQQNFTTQLNFNLFNTETGKQKPFVLPGYETSGTKTNTSIVTFNQGLKPTSNNNETVDRYYDNLVPYLLGRTLPQNWTTANTWKDKKLQVQLLGGDGSNLLSNFASLNGQTVFNVLSAGTFNGTDNETNFVKQILGALPYGNGIYDNKAAGTTNAAAGISRDLLASQSRVTLRIQQSELGLDYNYVINVLKSLDYSAQAKNPKGSDVKVENIAASSFTKKTNFALATVISATDLLNESDTWLKASDYVNLYLENNPSALTITNYDIARGEITVRFNINDVNGSPVNLVGLENNTMTIAGFVSLSSSFVDASGAAIKESDTTALDKLTDHFLPKNLSEIREWIKDHYQVNWLGLALKDGGATEGISTSHVHGYYKLSELANSDQYITNLSVQADSGALSFTVIIPASAANDNVPLSKSHNLTSFLKFGMNIDTTSYNKSSKQAVYDYQKNPELLKKFVQLVPSRTLNGGTVQTKTATSWWGSDESVAKTDMQLQTANLIPKYGTLVATVNASSDPVAGILNFDVSLLDNSAPASSPLPVLSTQTRILNGLYNYSSKFSLNGASTVGSIGVRYINDESKSNSTVSELNDVLKGYATASNQSDFRTWIQPLIDFSQSDQTHTAATSDTSGTWAPSPLGDDQKTKLVYGFGTSVTLTANDITNNVAFDADSNTLSINNLYVKGGYLNGHFYDGTDADAPVNALENSVYSFFSQATQTFDIGSFKTADSVASVKWNKKIYQGANTYFQHALNEWKDLLPSEWAARLLSLKNANRSNTVDEKTYQVESYDTLFSFLNHVINTSTSNTLYQTRIDINDVTQIQVNDFAGTITIPTNTLLIYNNYESDKTSSPDALNAQPKRYATEIKLQLSDYKSRLSEDVKNALPWKLDHAVNAQFQAVDGNVVQANLTQLLTAAQKLYNSTTLAANERTAALTAIQILAADFIADEYYTQPNANIFFSQKFGDTGPDDKANEYTQFESISYDDVDALNGSMKVTVKLKNYISGYDKTTNKYTLEDKTKQFSLTNLLRQFGTPIWNNNDKQTATSQVINLATTAPELKLFEPETDNPIFSYETISRKEFNDQTAETYYNQLMSKTENQLGEYIKIGADGFGLANWSIVDNYGVPPQHSTEENLKDLVAKITDAEIVIKKTDIHFSSRTNQIYFINPVIHFTGNYPDLVAKQQAMSNIFDPLRNTPNHVPFGSNKNFETRSLPNMTLVGFAKVPTHISLKSDVSKIQLGSETFNQNEVLPSQIYDWIQKNYSNSTELYNLFMSFYNLTGTSDLRKPITITLNPAVIAVLSQTNGSKDISSWISFNDGFGTISFKDAFFIFNTFNDKNQAAPTEAVVPITNFMVANSKAEFSLSNLKKSSFKNVEANEVVQAQISSNITTAMNELQQNNYRLAHELLMINEIKTNLVNDESQLEINDVTSNLQNGELLIHYTVRNTYANGQRINMSGVYVLRNFHSPIVPFLQAGLAPLLIGFAIIVLGVYFINRRYRNNMNTRKYTKKKIANKKG